MSTLMATRQVHVALSVTMCLSFLVYLFASDVFVSLTLVPTDVFVTNTRVWTFVTCSFIEGNFFRLLIDVVLVFIVAPPDVKFDQQFVLYFVSNVLASTIGSFMWLMIRFFGSGSQSFMLESCYGCGGVVMLLAMFSRRYLGDRPVIPQVPVVTFHYLPTVILCFVTILRILQLRSMTTDISFVYFTYFSSWTYLHFLHKVESEDSSIGDAFTFIAMFPEAFHPVVLPLSIATYNFFAMLGLFPKLELDRKSLQHHLRYHDSKQPIAGTGSVGEGSVSSISPSPSSNSGEDLIAERRRAKAIKLLDAKMAELSKEPEGWEDLKEDGGDKSKV